MMNDRVQAWLFALVRGLLCVVLSLAFGSSTLDLLGPPIEQSTQDCASDAGVGSPLSYRGSGNPRIVKRVVGDDHLAINAAVPDAIVAQTPAVSVRLLDTKLIIHRSADQHGALSVRGPPAEYTI